MPRWEVMIHHWDKKGVEGHERLGVERVTQRIRSLLCEELAQPLRLWHTAQLVYYRLAV